MATAWGDLWASLRVKGGQFSPDVRIENWNWLKIFCWNNMEQCIFPQTETLFENTDLFHPHPTPRETKWIFSSLVLQLHCRRSSTPWLSASSVGLAAEISRNCGSYSKALGTKDFSVSLLKRIKCKWQRSFKVSQLVLFALCVASATQVFLTNPVCSMFFCRFDFCCPWLFEKTHHFILEQAEIKACRVVSWQITFC